MNTIPMNINPGDKALVTTDNYFVAPDGRQYRAVFGTVKAARTAEDTLGIRPNGKSTNWYLEIGNMTIAGCQVHYLTRCENVKIGPVTEWNMHEGRHVPSERPCVIYYAD